jgi:hypothetical protein
MRDAPLKRPTVDQIEANEHADNDPPRLSLGRGVFLGYIVLAVGTSLGVLVDRPLAPRAGDRVVDVILSVLVPRWSIVVPVVVF